MFSLMFEPRSVEVSSEDIVITEVSVQLCVEIHSKFDRVEV